MLLKLKVKSVVSSGIRETLFKIMEPIQNRPSLDTYPDKVLNRTLGDFLRTLFEMNGQLNNRLYKLQIHQKILNDLTLNGLINQEGFCKEFPNVIWKLYIADTPTQLGHNARNVHVAFCEKFSGFYQKEELEYWCRIHNMKYGCWVDGRRNEAYFCLEEVLNKVFNVKELGKFLNCIDLEN